MQSTRNSIPASTKPKLRPISYNVHRRFAHVARRRGGGSNDARWHRVASQAGDVDGGESKLTSHPLPAADDEGEKPLESTTEEDAGTDGQEKAKAKAKAKPQAQEGAVGEAGKKKPLDLFASEELMEELKDSSQLGQRGEIWLVAQVVALVLVIFPPLRLVGVVYGLGVMAMAAGICFLGYGLLCLGRSFSPMPKPRQQTQLKVTGMYSLVRHPMYAGLLLCSLGLTAMTLSETRMVLLLLLWWVLEKKLAQEELMLGERFGEEHAAYVKSVPFKFVPYVY